MILANLKHQIKIVSNSRYREESKFQAELERIKNFPRYQSLSTDLLGRKLDLVDSLSFYASYKEIFERGIYAFNSLHESPLIIDGGSNIGISLLYFKELYPKAEIIAFEADKNIFETLEKNISSFGYQDIHLVNKALWSSETVLEFSMEGADGGRLSIGKDEAIANKTNVCTVRLRDYLDQPINLLKLDIEGAETDVILDCLEYLTNIENIFIEYHSFVNEGQRLNELLEVLREAGFRIQLHTQFSSPQPLLAQTTHLGMDLQLNIFGYRN